MWKKKLVVSLVVVLILSWTAFGTASWQNGSYQGEAKGFNGSIITSVTIEDGAISAVEVLEHSETPGISNAAFDNLIPLVIEGQTVEIDAVSGATYTSQGLLASIADALDKAQ